MTLSLTVAKFKVRHTTARTCTSSLKSPTPTSLSDTRNKLKSNCLQGLTMPAQPHQEQRSLCFNPPISKSCLSSLGYHLLLGIVLGVAGLWAPTAENLK